MAARLIEFPDEGHRKTGEGVDVDLTVTVLLAGTPTPTPARWGTAILVRSTTTTVLVDTGPGTTRRLVEAGLGPTDVDAVVFTHHHFDHTAGFPGFFLSRWDQGAGLIGELSIYGPPPTQDFVRKLFGQDYGAFWPDLNARMEAPGSHAVFVNRGGELPRLPPDPDVREVHPDQPFTVGDIEFLPGLARHVQPYLDCNAYRITAGASSVVYTGDTEPCDEIVELSRGADVLISMCWDEAGVMAANGEATGQTGTLGAARMARDAGVDDLVLTHIGPSISAGIHEGELGAMASIHQGGIHQAVEGWTFGV
jgi:ribonuclease BN (tRNA processing enzyme)